MLMHIGRSSTPTTGTQRAKPTKSTWQIQQNANVAATEWMKQKPTSSNAPTGTTYTMTTDGSSRNFWQNNIKILKCELLRCIYCVHQPSRQAIWGAEDLGTILEYLALRWRYSAYQPGIEPGTQRWQR